MSAEKIMAEAGIDDSWRGILLRACLPSTVAVAGYMRERGIDPTAEGVIQLRDKIVAAVERALEDFR